MDSIEKICSGFSTLRETRVIDLRRALAVDGSISVVLVPHINRQEVYPGQLKDSEYFDPTLALIGLTLIKFGY